MVEFTVDPVTGAVDSFTSARLTGERMTAAHASFLERMHTVAEVMANVGGVRTVQTRSSP